jgi:hypothetical protein
MVGSEEGSQSCYSCVRCCGTSSSLVRTNLLFPTISNLLFQANDGLKGKPPCCNGIYCHPTWQKAIKLKITLVMKQAVDLKANISTP